MTMIVAFSGKMGSGKTWLASKLREWLIEMSENCLLKTELVHVHKYSFATKIKRYAREVLKEETRSAFQRAGDILRREDPDVTVHDFENMLRELPKVGINIVLIDDARCLNEITAILHAGGHVFGVLADDRARLVMLATRDSGKVPSTDETNHKTEPDVGSLFNSIEINYTRDLAKSAHLLWNDYSSNPLKIVKKKCFPLLYAAAEGSIITK